MHAWNDKEREWKVVGRGGGGGLALFLLGPVGRMRIQR